MRRICSYAFSPAKSMRTSSRYGSSEPTQLELPSTMPRIDCRRAVVASRMWLGLTRLRSSCSALTRKMEKKSPCAWKK
jgi:hypothetical protein